MLKFHTISTDFLNHIMSFRQNYEKTKKDIWRLIGSNVGPIVQLKLIVAFKNKLNVRVCL